MRENDERPAVPAAGPLRSARAGRRPTIPVPLEVSDICLQPAVQQAGSADRLIAERAFPLALRFMARGFLAAHEAAPRTAALFATQQRWLLCHAGLAQYFLAARRGGAGLTRRGLGLLARQHGIASRNTAYAFFDEALKYEVVLPVGMGEEVVPSALTLSILTQWYGLHLHVLDLIDGRCRSARFLAEPERLLTHLVPRVGMTLVSDADLYRPGPFYTIFTWADAGGLLMDRFIAGLEEGAVPEAGNMLTDVSPISSLAEAFGLSRAHTSRQEIASVSTRSRMAAASAVTE